MTLLTEATIYLFHEEQEDMSQVTLHLCAGLLHGFPF